MRKLIMGAAVALPLAFAGTAQADTNVQSLTGDWSVSNSTVNKVEEGVHFGPYATGANRGSLLWKGANGTKLSDVRDISFTFNYKQAGNATGASPYARIWLDTDHDNVWTNGVDTTIMLDSSKGGAFGTLAQGIDHTFGNADDSIRINDDAGDFPQKTWAEAVQAYGNEKIIMAGVTTGGAMGTDVSATVKNLIFNGERFNFDAPADGTPGPQGPKGDTGAAGKDGVSTTNTEDTVAVPVARGSRGATLRTLHVRKVAGMKFISARASLDGKSVRTIRGRAVKVDLRGKSVGRYRVFITAKYKAHGKVYKVHSTRTLRIIQK